MAAPQNHILSPNIGPGPGDINGSGNVMGAPSMATAMAPTLARPARPPPPPLDTMRAYRACLNCRNRKSKCDLDINQGRPVSEEGISFTTTELGILLR